MVKRYCCATARHKTIDGIRQCCYEPDLYFGLHWTRKEAKIAFIKMSDPDFKNATDERIIMQFNHLSRNLRHFKVIAYEEQGMAISSRESNKK